MPSGIDSHYQTYFPAIREKCRRMLGDSEEAQDVAQETFIKLWRSGLADADVRRATAWIYTTSTRLAVDRLRRRRRSTALAASQGPVAPVASGNLEDALLTREELERLAAHVSGRELEVAVLHRLDGVSQPEIAQLTGSSERTVRRLLERFDASLKTLRSKGATP
ncbi:MAG: RNA polymerase sigma factor [Myxococcales bacterium]